MSSQKLTIVRLQKQQRGIEIDPIPNLLVKRKGFLDFHFCIYGLEAPYAGGFYHGVLQLSPEYPFSPPQLKFYTESGRFQTNKPICTSFTNFHKQQWSSAWNIRTMLLGVISFMTSSEGGNGSLKTSNSKKMELAKKSLGRNLQSPLFVELFRTQINKLGRQPMENEKQRKQAQKSIKSQGQPQKLKGDVTVDKIQNSNEIYILVVLLFLVIAAYSIIKRDSSNQL